MSRAGVVTLGEALAVLSSRDAGGLDDIATLDIGIGGAEANVAFGLARLGIPVTWIGTVGDDGFGRRIVRVLRGTGVEVRATVDPTSPTGLIVKSRPLPGITEVEYRRAGSAGSRISPSALDATSFAGAALVHLTGITPALSPEAAATTRRALELARESGIPVSVDLNHRRRLWPDEPSAVAWLRDLAAVADILFASEEEAALLTDADIGDPAGLAAGLAGDGRREVVVTSGAAGATAFYEGRLEHVPAVPVDVVDTVGAGDAFAAGYLARRLAGAGLRERLEWGTRAGAAVCTTHRDAEGMPRADELARWLDGDPVTR